MISYQSLFDLAIKGLKNAYAPYSHFQVSAAVLMKHGEIYHGVNVENASYGASICAERSAFVQAISSGQREFQAIAIVATKDNQLKEATPCGICLQFMHEFSDDLDIIIGVDSDNLRIYKITELLTNGFCLSGKEEK